MILDVLVIGGGLSGMVIAQRLSAMAATSTAATQQLNWKLLEARSVLGGRLCNDNEMDEIDLGGAWIWPEHQPLVKNLVKTLAVETFPQPGDPDSTRFSGGAVQLIRKLNESVPQENIHLDSPVQSCSLVTPATTSANSDADTCVDDNSSNEPYIEVRTTKDEVFRARHVVFAAPPKLLSKHVQFDPPLSPEKTSAMANSQTWMAGVTKIGLVYPTRFWDVDYANTGLPPGSGPAFQMYDSSTQDASKTAAITFFSLVPSNTPAYSDDSVLAELVARQLGGVWGMMGQLAMSEKAHSYTSYCVHRWPKETYLSEDDAPKRINPHPSPVRALTTTDWNGMLHFAGSEADRRSPGVMEGAVGAAHRVLDELKQLFV